MNEQRIIITLSGRPGEIPIELRVRMLLKAATRRFGLRCLKIEQTPPAAPAKENEQCLIQVKN